MLRLIGTVLLMMLCVMMPKAQACIFPLQNEPELYGVFNQLFYEADDSNRLGSNIALLNSSYAIPDGADLTWAAGEQLQVDLTYQGTGFFWQELGYTNGSEYVSLVDRQEMRPLAYTPQSVDFTVPDGFMWTDSVGLFRDEPLQRWYADASLNPLGAKDHFLSFQIDDDERLAVFNDLYGTSYSTATDDVWLIAFESFDLGYGDYTDLVAVISRPHLDPPAHAPLPGSFLLMSTVLLGLLSRKNIFKGFIKRNMVCA